MLQVAVEQQHVREVAAERARKAGAYGAPFPAIAVMDDDVSARGAGPLRGPIRRPIIHDDDAIDQRRDAPDDRRDRARFVEGWNHRGGAQGHRGFPPSSSAGSTSTDAAASAMVLTADTTPIDRSGGYEEG